MAKNKLDSSIIRDDSGDCCVMLFLDKSEYLVDAKNPILNITPPNFTDYISLEYNMNAITILKAENIGFETFSSGIYKFEHSVCPNDKVKRSFCYLNICEEIACINRLKCEEDDEKILEELVNLYFEFQIAQDSVNLCSVNQALCTYNIAKKKLENLINKSQCDVC
jgi:hypothetical protein